MTDRLLEGLQREPDASRLGAVVRVTGRNDMMDGRDTVSNRPGSRVDGTIEGDGIPRPWDAAAWPRVHDRYKAALGEAGA